MLLCVIIRMIDWTLTRDAFESRRNLSVVWLDFKKAYDMGYGSASMGEGPTGGGEGPEVCAKICWKGD